MQTIGKDRTSFGAIIRVQALCNGQSPQEALKPKPSGIWAYWPFSWLAGLFFSTDNGALNAFRQAAPKRLESILRQGAESSQPLPSLDITTLGPENKTQEKPFGPPSLGDTFLEEVIAPQQPEALTGLNQTQGPPEPTIETSAPNLSDTMRHWVSEQGGPALATADHKKETVSSAPVVVKPITQHPIQTVLKEHDVDYAPNQIAILADTPDDQLENDAEAVSFTLLTGKEAQEYKASQSRLSEILKQTKPLGTLTVDYHQTAQGKQMRYTPQKASFSPAKPMPDTLS